MTALTPYYADDAVTLYCGDMREILPALDIAPDCVVTDPPYGETSLAWDRWPDGWPTLVADVTSSLWCFGSMRMFLDRRDEFTAWRMSQDVIWEKNAGSSIAADRFKRTHEHVVHWYRGAWRDVHHEAQREPERPLWSGEVIKVGRKIVGKGDRGEHLGTVRRKQPWVNDGTRLVTSVIRAANLRGRGLHPTEKPVPLLDPLIRYACPPKGLVLDPFAGSGSTAAAARLSGRRAVLIEADERYCEAIARRLAQNVLPLPQAAAQ